MGLQVWLPLNKDTNVIPGISSFSKEGSVTFTEDTDGWYKVVDSSHTSSRWGIYYNFDVKPSTTYTLTVYSKSTTGISCSIGIGSFQGAVAWPAVRDTNNTSTEKLTTYTWTTTQNDTKARIYLAMNPGSTVANNYVFYKEPKVCEALTSQGLSNITATNNGATVDNNGKIGKCYSFSGSSTKITIPFQTAVSSAIGTISCWVKFNSFPTSSTWFNLIQIGASGGFAACRLGMYMEYTDKINISINGSTTGQNVYTHSLTTGKWYHLCAIFDGTTVKLYLDGNQVLSKTATVGSYTTSASTMFIGGTNNYWLKGCVNDVRYYDNVLSAKEVKLLSQGLILHYPLDRNGWGQDNLATCTTPVYNIAASASSNYNYIWINNNTLEPNTTYTFSAEVTVSDSDKCTVYNYTASGKSGSINYNFPADGKRHSWTFTTTADAIGFIAYAGTAGSTAGHSAVYKNIKIEKGNKATPYIPRAAESLYTTMGIGNAVEYDISGYQNNGIRKNTFTYTTNSSKYKLATIFNGSNNSIAAGQGAKVKDAITISCWGYMNSWSSYNGRLLSCTEGGGWNFEPSSGKMNFAMGTGTYSNTYKSVTSTTTLAQLGSGWHMFTGTYDGFNTKIYIDGVLENTNAAYTTKTPIYYLAANGIFVGAEAAGSATDPTGSYFNGYLSDVRIYATALSADDIKSLYESNRL